MEFVLQIPNYNSKRKVHPPFESFEQEGIEIPKDYTMFRNSINCANILTTSEQETSSTCESVQFVSFSTFTHFFYTIYEDYEDFS